MYFANRYCFKNFKSLDINTPRSLFLSIHSSKFLVLYILYITLHLFTLKSTSQLFAQATNLSKVLWMDLISLRVFTQLDIFASSANLEVSQSTSSSTSSIKIVKRSVPKTDPCGTPPLISVQPIYVHLIVLAAFYPPDTLLFILRHSPKSHNPPIF